MLALVLVRNLLVCVKQFDYHRFFFSNSGQAHASTLVLAALGMGHITSCQDMKARARILRSQD